MSVMSTKRSKKRLQKNAFLRQRLENETNAQPGPQEMILVLDNLKSDFNIGKLLRSAAVFGVHEVHIIGTPYFDPHPAKGGFKLVPVHFYNSFEPSIERLRELNYQIYALDFNGELLLGTFALPERSAFILGNEGVGISFDYRKLGIACVTIPQLGKVTSLNVSVAGSIALYEYLRQHRGEVEKKVNRKSSETA